MQDGPDEVARGSDALSDPKPYIDELDLGGSRNRFGFKVGGAVPGPTLLVASHASLARHVYQRLLLIPSLNRLRGEMYLVALEKLENADDAASLREALGISSVVDRSIILSPTSLCGLRPSKAETAAGRCYWQVLRLCADLGMIDGRGVPGH